MRQERQGGFLLKNLTSKSPVLCKILCIFKQVHMQTRVDDEKGADVDDDGDDGDDDDDEGRLQQYFSPAGDPALKAQPHHH